MSPEKKTEPELFATDQNLREKQQKIRSLNPKVRGSPTNELKDFLTDFQETDEYQQGFEELCQSSIFLRIDKNRLEHSFRLGLKLNLKAWDNVNQIQTQENAKESFRSFILHCHETVQNFRNKTPPENYRQAIFYSIVEAPYCLSPDIYQQLLQQSTTNSYLSEEIIFLSIRKKPIDINSLIKSKTEMYYDLISRNDLPKTFSPNFIRLIVTQYLDPYKFIGVEKPENIKIYIPECHKEPNYFPKQREKVLQGKKGFISKDTAERLITNIIFRNNLQQPPKQESSIDTAPQEEVHNFESLRNIFPNDIFFEDWLLQYFLNRYQNQARNKLEELKVNTLNIQKQLGEEGISDNQTVKHFLIFYPDNYSSQLQKCQNQFKEIKEKHKTQNNPIASNDRLLRLIITFFPNNAETVISKTTPIFERLIRNTKGNPFIAENKNILFFYLIQNSQNIETAISQHTEQFLYLKHKYQQNESIYGLSKDIGDDLIRYFIIQYPQDPESKIKESLAIYQSLSLSFDGDQTLGNWSKEAILSASFFYPRQAENFINSLVRMTNKSREKLQSKYPDTNTVNQLMNILIPIIIRQPQRFNEMLNTLYGSPNSQITIPPKTLIDTFIYKNLFSYFSQKLSEKQMNRRTTLD